MGLDPVIIERRQSTILREITFLEMIKLQGNDEFLTDGRNQRSTAKAIETIVQCVIDIASHIIAQNHWGVSDSYKHAIVTLSQNEILSNSVSLRLQELVAMRNILVHQYLDIDYQIIWESIDDVIEDANNFVKAIKNFLLLKE